MVGTKVAHYEVLKSLGAGGMGAVYSARDTELHRVVALKVLLPHALDDASARALLLKEARTASSLNHPNICTIYQVGESDGIAFIAMEMVDGGPVSDRIGAAGLPIETVLRYGVQIADALAYAHTNGVVHRDIKSSNVLVSRDDRVKVSDFGLARQMRSGAPGTVTLTSAGVIAGTPHFMAPELLLGRPADVGSDVWALGVLMFEMASGTLPFTGRTEPELNAAVLNGEPAPLPARVPRELADLIRRCLEKDPARRPPTALDVRTALEAMSSGARAALAAPAPRRAWRVELAFAFFGMDVGGVRSRLMGGGSGGRIASLAVLPLDNFSRDPGQQYFADGMTEDLITEVAQIEGLRVISRTSVMRYKGTTRSVPQIARELGVDAILEGSVQHAGDRVRITAQLVRGDRDEHVWAHSYERPASDVLALQSDVARAIAHEIQQHLTPRTEAKLAKRAPVDPRAYELVLMGRYQLNRFTTDATTQALRSFQQAIAIDSNYAPAWTWLGEAYGQGAVPDMPRSEAVRHAREAIERAIRLDPDLGTARAALGDVKFHLDWDWEGAAREYRRAIELSPSDVDARLQYSHYLLAIGRLDEAVAQGKKALELDPLSPVIHDHLGALDIAAGRYAEAIEKFQHVISLDRGFASAYLDLAETYLLTGRFEEGLVEYRRSVAMGGMSGPSDSTLVLALIDAHAGRKAMALDKVQAYEASHANADAIGTQYFVAAVYAAMGDADQAFEWLDRAYRRHDEALTNLKLDPLFLKLRGDPRFPGMLKRMNLPA
jgi:TolB-like protein/Tfp pilus assembly protein PilF